MFKRIIIKICPIFSVFCFMEAVSFNALANITRFNNLLTKEVSEMYNNYFVPAGFTFSIWAIIFTLMLAFTVYINFIILTNNSKPRHVYITNFFSISSLANASWIYLWHYLQLKITVILMAILLISLIVMYIFSAPKKSEFTVLEKWLLHTPIVIYLAWICVASIANMAAYLTYAKWHGFRIQPTYWSCIMISIATLLALYFIWVKKEIFFGIVICWALNGIRVKQQDISLISTFSIIAMMMLLISVAINFNYYYKTFVKNKDAGKRILDYYE
jgi:translocator protein